MIFAVFDPSPLTLCINCSFFTFIFAVLLPVLSRLLIMSNPLILHFSIFQDGGRPTSKIFKSLKYHKSTNKRRVAIERWVSYKRRAPNRRRVTGGYGGMYGNLLIYVA